MVGEMRRGPAWVMRPGLVLVCLAVLGSACGETPAPPHGGLVVYVDGARILDDDSEALAGRRADYDRGGLRGWTLFGGLVDAGVADRATRIVARDVQGTELVIDDPRGAYADLVPVVFVDRRQDLRFTMVDAEGHGGGNAVAHGRGPGDGRGGGGGRGEARPRTLANVREIVIETTGTQPSARVGRPVVGGSLVVADVG